MIVELDSVGVSFGARLVFAGVSFYVHAGERWALIGRNGCGKSTLVRCMAGLLAPASGSVLLNGVETGKINRRDFARMVAYVPQAMGRLIPYTVSEYVFMGRFAYSGLYARADAHDQAVVREALALTDSEALANQTMDTLSGGELQRVLIAGAVAQEPQLLLLDEPTTFLDPLHCEMIHAALRRIHDEKGTTLVSVTHDIDAAFSRYSHLCALGGSGVIYSGPIDQIADRVALLEQVFGLRYDQAVTQSGREILVPSGVLP